jgi:hypothetical protein
MDFLTLFFFGLMGLLVLVLLHAVVVLIARSVGALVKLCMRSNECSAGYGAKATMVTYGVLVAFICYQSYTALYPSEDFYLDELQTVTARQPPAEARVIAKDATYPDLHGDYCSFSRINISEWSYRKLLDELKTDERFTPDGNGEISRGGLAASNLRPLRVTSSFSRSDVKPDHHYEISFLESGAEIEVAICVT